METQSKALTWSGRVLSGLVVLMLTMSATMKLIKRPEATQPMIETLEFPEDRILVVGILELSCVILYAIPQTAILGALLLTGYLGGAVATHVRAHDNFLSPAIGGVLVWLGVFLRDPRVRALLPFRRLNPPAAKNSRRQVTVVGPKKRTGAHRKNHSSHPVGSQQVDGTDV